MKEYYWENKEYGYRVPESFLLWDAELECYYDITEPDSPDYLNFNLHYTKTLVPVK